MLTAFNCEMKLETMVIYLPF